MCARKRWIVPSSRFQRHHAAAAAVSSMMRSSAKYSMKNSASWRSALAVERVQHGVAGAVGGGAGALRGALAVIAWSCRRRRADRSCRPRCARTARPNARARRPPAGALRQRYSMASWSPSQSEPLTVSYMCQRQSSSPMLPSAAAMPPCAATVWLRVGNTLVMQAVFRPASLRRRWRAGRRRRRRRRRRHRRDR